MVSTRLIEIRKMSGVIISTSLRMTFISTAIIMAMSPDSSMVRTQPKQMSLLSVSSWL